MRDQGEPIEAVARRLGMRSVDRTFVLIGMESLLEYEALWDCAAAIPDPPPQVGGRPRQYPGWALVLFDGLCTVFTSAGRTETNLPFSWPKLRERFSALYPDQPPLPVAPPQRHHWQYAKRLVGEEAWTKMRASFRGAAVATALEIGLFDPAGAGSFTHPDRTRLIYGDGKMVKPLSKCAPGETWVDEHTGEVKPRRADPDTAWYIVGGDEEPHGRGTRSVDGTPERPTKRGEQVRGLKTCFVMGRSPEPHGRVLLDFDHCPKDEMGFALASLAQMAPRLPGLRGLVWDGAGRGTHASQLGRALGIHLISPVTPGLGGHTTDRAAVYKPRRVGTMSITRPDGTVYGTELYGLQGAAHILEVDSSGNEVLLPAKRLKTERRNSDGMWRMYNLWQAPMAAPSESRLSTPTTTSCASSTGPRDSAPSRPPTLTTKSSTAGATTPKLRTACSTTASGSGDAHSMGAQRHLLDWLGYGLVVNAVVRRCARLVRASQQGLQAA
jgi:hypothetical protein